jgi:hypothetical protein
VQESELGDNAPPPARREWAMSPTLPLPPPRSDDDLDKFLGSIAAIEVGEIEQIRAMISGFDDPGVIAAIFNRALAARPCGDIGRFMMLLSVTGQLRHDSSLSPLEAVVWASDADLGGDVAERDSMPSVAPGCMFPWSGMIQARAAEMFAWIGVRRFDDQLLKIVTSHPLVTTRLAAADSYLFHHNDSPEALERVLAVAISSDRSGIGVPRLAREGDRDAFNKAYASAAAGESEMPLPQRLEPKDHGHGGAQCAEMD